MSELSIQFWFIGPPREEPESLSQLFILTDFPSAFRQKQKGDTAAIVSLYCLQMSSIVHTLHWL